LQSTSLETYVVQPSAAQVKTSFTQKIQSKEWKDNFLISSPNYQFEFPGERNVTTYLSYPGNPIYKTMVGSSTNTNSIFNYELTTKLTIGADFLRPTDVDNLNNCFWTLPTASDVRDAIIGKYSSASSYYWSALTFDISQTSATGGEVIVGATADSLYYQGNRTIAFTYKS
jgi:hypothetical protein